MSANNLPRRNRDSIVLDITKYSMKDNRHWTVCIKAIKIRLWLIHFKVINSCFSLNIRIMKVYRGLLVIDFLLSIRFPPLILFEQDRLRFCNSDPVYKTRNMSNKQFLSIFSTSQCWPASSRHCVNIVLTFGTYPVYVDISTFQCWPTSSWHNILIVCLLSCLDCRHRRQCNIDWHWVTMLMSKKCRQCRQSLLDID